MSQTVFVQTVFCPTRKMLDFQLKSLRSLHSYLESHPFEMDIIFAGYIDNEYYDELITEIKSLFYKRCQFQRYEKNYGKAHVVNTTLRSYLGDHPETKYIFTLDSDICFHEHESNIFSRLINLSVKVSDVQKRPFGLIACNFTGDNAHWIQKFENKAAVCDEVITWPTSPVGIAGGCIFINTDAWQKIGGYRVMGVYAPDDAALMQDMHRNGYGISVAETITVHHPGTHDDPYYQTWKEATCRNVQHLGESQNHCDTFWAKTKVIEDANTKLKLSDVTLLIVDCCDVNRAIRAIEHSCKEVEYGAVKLLTSISTDYKYAIAIDHINSKEEYSHFCIKKMGRYVDTNYVLLIQHDGFVIGGKKAWVGEFMEYDYIGAPWNYTDGLNVGNGGFSLRSKKLLDILMDERINQYHPEDHHIGRTFRPLLESIGIKFPAEELAWKFAIECGNKYGWDYKGQFGFHGFDVINNNDIKLEL